MNEGIELIVDLLNKWKDNSYIEGVIGIENKVQIDQLEDIAKWLHNPRVLGSKEKKVQLFFKLQTNISIVEIY